MAINRQLLRDVIVDQSKASLDPGSIPREKFNDLVRFSKTGQVIIISGLRRCGKSTLLQQIRAENSEVDYYLNFDDDRLCQFTLEDFQQLLEVFIELFGVQKTCYFDEIQNIQGWERFVRRLHDEKYSIFVTGSNASMLSKELGTHLTGRHLQLELFPFSFREYLLYKKKKQDYVIDRLTTAQKGVLKSHWNKYLKVGGLPEYFKMQQKEYLHYLYEGILYRDIITRYSLSKEKTLKELCFYLASNVSMEVSFNSLRKLLHVGSPRTISEYCGYLENAYLIFLVPRYNRSLKKQIHFNKKIYFSDTALAEAIGFRWSEDRGRMLENSVFLELRRRGGNIYFHKEKNECDFLLREGLKIKKAIQVTVHLDNEKTRTREFLGIKEAIETYGLKEGFILTDNTEGVETINTSRGKKKIWIVPVWKHNIDLTIVSKNK